MYSVDISGGEALIRLLQEAGDRAPEALRRMVEETATFYLDRLRARSPRKTGNLAGSHLKYRRGPLEAVVSVDMTRAPYALYVHEGRGPVFPVRKRALWWDELEHPVASAGPAKAQPWFEWVLREAPAERVVEDNAKALLALFR